MNMSEPEDSPVEDLFRSVCEAILEDGKVEPWEAHLMQDVTLLLGLDQASARRIFAGTREATQRYGAIKPDQPERRALYGRILTLIAEDGKVDSLEHRAFEGLRRAWMITDDEHMAAIRRLTGS